MASKKQKFVDLKSLSFVIAFLTIGWPQAAKAQYNLQIDSVITKVIRGQFTNTSDTIKFEVPAGKVWKIQSAWTSFKSTSPGSSLTMGHYGRIDLRIEDAEGEIFTIISSKSTGELLSEAGVATSNIFVNHYNYAGGAGSTDDTGQIWLNAGSQIVFSIRPPASGTTGGFYRGFLSALQFSIE
ncbi:hypothetical protein N9N81_01625 [Schleiferiaceae bacterium]|nr:hypothetical protein [Schleiferiaceae bacterium]MDC0377489.1 hypothetical protein [Schleiferiaceae bacterium]